MYNASIEYGIRAMQLMGPGGHNKVPLYYDHQCINSMFICHIGFAEPTLPYLKFLKRGFVQYFLILFDYFLKVANLGMKHIMIGKFLFQFPSN